MIAPFGGHDGWKDMAFDRRDEVGVDIGRVAGDAEGAILAKPPGAAGDLGDLLGMEPAHAPAVEFAQARESDMVDVHVQAHADRVGGDQEIDLAGLEQLDLGVAGARTERAHHHRRAAALAADEFGDGVDRVGGEGDDGAAPRQAGQLLRARVGQLRQALAELDLGSRDRADGSGRRRSPRPSASSRPSRARAGADG